MIISHKYNFIFIKTFKTAGTSIEVFLSQCCGDNDVLTPLKPHIEPHVARNHRGYWNPLREIRSGGLKEAFFELKRRRKFFNHIPAQTVRNRISPHVWNRYFKFCVERNPWDKTLSHYHMVNDRAGGDVTFKDYINEGNFCLNYPIYTDENGALLVDEVLKYESLVDDLARVFKMLEVPFEGSLGVRAKSEHRRDKRPYQEVISDDHRDVIANAFAREIELHGYEF